MPGTLVFPLDSRRMGRQILSRVESLPLHPKGCPLVCLVETPGGGRGGGQKEQQRPHHCPGGAFLRESGGATQGTRTAPTSPASTALPASPTAFTRAASGGTRRNICVLEDSALLPGSHSRACPVSVRGVPFPPHRLGPRSPPAGSGSWGARENPGVSPGCCLTFLLQPL